MSSTNYKKLITNIGGKAIIMKTNELKNTKAITLVALVVSIIVLLILAGVSISALTGENRAYKKCN